MATAWLSYAWLDNQEKDVDFAAQELKNAGVGIKLDRWNIQAGRRLWEQIETFICNPAESDAWILYATQNSLGSEPCREEFAYALSRALSERGAKFPVIGLFQGPVNSDLIPAGIKTRLYISLTDPDWKERIKATCEGRELAVSHEHIEPYQLTVHQPSTVTGGKFVIEVRPRAGTWAPFFAAVPTAEKSHVELSIQRGPRGRLDSPDIMQSHGEGASANGLWWLEIGGEECTPTKSYFLTCTVLPSFIGFGVCGGTPTYMVALGAVSVLQSAPPAGVYILPLTPAS